VFVKRDAHRLQLSPADLLLGLKDLFTVVPNGLSIMGPPINKNFGQVRYSMLL
jgi:hypothetical protein